MNVVRLVKKAKKGDKDALLELILAEKEAYYKLALTYTGNQHDAMDAMEEMIVVLYEKITQLKKDEAFYSWSKTILVNHCRAMLRKQKKVVSIDEWVTANNQEPRDERSSASYRSSEQFLDIQESLKHINTHQKEAIQLKYFHDLDYETIAAVTNVSIGTAKSRVFQGLKKLREYYGGEKDETS